MLQAPSSQLSRVCGHGHIKKLCLMQTQNEGQACEAIWSPATSTSSSAAPSSSFKSSTSCSQQWRPSSAPVLTSLSSTLLSCAQSLIPACEHINDAELSPSIQSARQEPEATHHQESPGARSSLNLKLHATIPNHCKALMCPSCPTKADCYGQPGQIRQHLLETSSVRGSMERGCIPGSSSPSFLLSTVDMPSSSSIPPCTDMDAGFRNNGSSNLTLGSLQHYQHVRTCTMCATSKTPLWRSGPQGPKSLCNACGIRYKKSRKLLQQQEESAPSFSDLLSPTLAQPFKRKHGVGVPDAHSSKMNPGHKRLLSAFYSFYQKKPLIPKFKVKAHQRLQNASLSVTRADKSGRIPKTVAEDEAAAARLLMFLSCGLARG